MSALRLPLSWLGRAMPPEHVLDEVVCSGGKAHRRPIADQADPVAPDRVVKPQTAAVAQEAPVGPVHIARRHVDAGLGAVGGIVEVGGGRSLPLSPWPLTVGPASSVCHQVRAWRSSIVESGPSHSTSSGAAGSSPTSSTSTAIRNQPPGMSTTRPCHACSPPPATETMRFFPSAPQHSTARSSPLIRGDGATLSSQRSPWRTWAVKV